MGIKSVVKRIVYSSSFLEKVYSAILEKKNSKGCQIENSGFGRYRIINNGTNNKIVIGKNTWLHDTKFLITGNNTIVIKDSCSVGIGCSFWIEGNNSSITIGAGTSFTQLVHFCAQENGVRITVGNDCMFSNNIIVRTSDSHPIYDMLSGERINYAKDVTIEDHVWIAPNSKIMKGAVIGQGTVVGSDTMVTKPIEAYSLVVGHPAKIVKSNIKWTRENLF